MTSSRSHRRRPVVLALALALGLALAAGALPFAAPPARAATLTVNTVGDGGDREPGDGVCDSGPAPGNQCSLRAAIQVANATPGADTIRFDIPGGGLKTIRPNSQLPTITGPVTIDGYTQPGARPNTAAVGTNAVLTIELDGSNAGAGVDGLQIRGSNSLVRGLVINRFNVNGVYIVPGTARVRIAGCFVGTDPGGTLARGNGDRGILADDGATAATIGGSTPAARNLVSANAFDGVFVSTADRPANHLVLGNLIGTTRSGADPLGNGGAGIVSVATGVTIGGAPPGHPNTIAFNQGDGVEVSDVLPTNGNRILVNSIFANGGRGIDLGGNGRTPNDPQDPDPGANFLQNFPVITSATPNRVEGTLNSNPNRSFTIRLFANPGAGDEGRAFAAGPVTVTTDASGDATFVFRPTAPLPAGVSVTATATRDDGNTSEFSDPKPVTSS